MSDHADEVLSAYRKSEALKMRIGGHTYDEIAERLGFASRSGAFKAVQTALAEHVRPPAEELRTLELERLDALFRAWWRAATAEAKPDEKAAQLVLRIIEHRCRLLGLNRPAIEDLEDWLREQARREGLDPDQAVADAQRLVRDHQREWGMR